VVRALGLHKGNWDTKFSDVNESDWFAESAAIASEYGLIKGYDDGTFRPNDVITREEAMVITARALEIAGAERMESDIVVFKDSQEVSSWAEKAAKECAGSGVIKGDDRRIAPKEKITRAETAAIIMRMLEAVNLIKGALSTKERALLTGSHN